MVVSAYTGGIVMRISNLEAEAILLPFKLSFGHALASRNNSVNVVVKATVVDDNGNCFSGYGESVPRDYVTGETVNGALKTIEGDYFPSLEGLEFVAALDALKLLRERFSSFGLEDNAHGASWCAVELAIIDAVCRASGLSFSALLSIYDVTRSGSGVAPSAAPGAVDDIVYGGVIPFGGVAESVLILSYYRYLGLTTVKMKVGRDWHKDRQVLRLARTIMGPDAILRVDANCAWTVDETLYFAEKMKEFRITSIERPVNPGNISGMQKLTRELSETVVADQSLCTISQARNLIENRACDAFNIRLSKVGGPLIAMEIADLARANGVGVMLGAQVGESAILSAAGRGYAAVKGPFDNCEGSFNRYLLRQDLSADDVTLGKEGRAPVFDRPGIGVEIDEWRVKRFTVASESEVSSSDSNQKSGELTRSMV